MVAEVEEDAGEVGFHVDEEAMATAREKAEKMDFKVIEEIIMKGITEVMGISEVGKQLTVMVYLRMVISLLLQGRMEEEGHMMVGVDVAVAVGE
jgi:hypothetical protein